MGECRPSEARNFQGSVPCTIQSRPPLSLLATAKIVNVSPSPSNPHTAGDAAVISCHLWLVCANYQVVSRRPRHSGQKIPMNGHRRSLRGARSSRGDVSAQPFRLVPLSQEQVTEPRMSFIRRLTDYVDPRCSWLYFIVGKKYVNRLKEIYMCMLSMSVSLVLLLLSTADDAANDVC